MNVIDSRFWDAKLRETLCTCNTCSELYKSLKVSFVLDASDRDDDDDDDDVEMADAVPLTGVRCAMM